MLGTRRLLLVLTLLAAPALADDLPPPGTVAKPEPSGSWRRGSPSQGGWPLPWTEHMRAGLSLYDAGKYAEALERFGKAEVECDKPERIHYNKGLCHLGLAEFDQAEQAFAKVAGGADPLLSLQARYNTGHVHYRQALRRSTDAGTAPAGKPAAPVSSTDAGQAPGDRALLGPGVELDEARLARALDCFRDVIRAAAREPLAGSAEAARLAADARRNERLIVTRLKDLVDRRSRKLGEKENRLHGTVNVNGRPVAGAWAYVKSKWEQALLGHARSGEGGGYEIKDLDLGKYNLAALLYEEDKPERIPWGPPRKVPAHGKDPQDLAVNGPVSLACPYLASVASLPAPWDDHGRKGGAASLTSSTDWGELTDGRPADTFPADNDLDPGYVAFAEPEFQVVMALPPARPRPEVKSSTEPAPPPEYLVTLKGYRDGKDAAAPDALVVLGLKGKDEKPVSLYEGPVETTAAGRYEWKSFPFPQQDCRQLAFVFHRSKGKRTSLHEIEVAERDPSKKNDKEQEKDKDKQDQQQDEPKPQDQPEQKQDQASQDTQQILKDIRKKAEENGKNRRAAGGVLRADRDW